MITYPASTGRNFNEVLRVVDSLQPPPVSVRPRLPTGNMVKMYQVTAVSTEDAIKKFEKGVNIIKPYLRYTPQPNLN